MGRRRSNTTQEHRDDEHRAGQGPNDSVRLRRAAAGGRVLSSDRRDGRDQCDNVAGVVLAAKLFRRRRTTLHDPAGDDRRRVPTEQGSCRVSRRPSAHRYEPPCAAVGARTRSEKTNPPAGFRRGRSAAAAGTGAVDGAARFRGRRIHVASGHSPATGRPGRRFSSSWQSRQRHLRRGGGERKSRSGDPAVARRTAIARACALGECRGPRAQHRRRRRFLFRRGREPSAQPERAMPRRSGFVGRALRSGAGQSARDVIDTAGAGSGTTAHALGMAVQEVLSASSAGSNQIGAPATPRQPIDVVSGGTFTASLAASPFSLSSAPVHTFTTPRQLVWNVGLFQQAKVRLVALASWQFTCEGPGTFRELMQHLDDAMFGTVAAAGHPALADTGHLKLTLQDRVGVAEDVWYRGPLVSSQLTRDPLGPYQSADQARRVTPDTGAEDISYAAAFEVGRLLAAADPRFAQAIMGWRRRSYKASARASTISDLAARARLTMPAAHWYTPMAGLFATQAITSVVQSNPPIADAYGLAKVASAPGMQPNALATAWNLGSAARATTLLGGDPGTLGAVVEAAPQTTRPAVTVDFVIGDTAGFGRLTAARQQAFDNTAAKLGGR